MIAAAAIVAAALLLALSVLQVVVACGRPYGALVWGGQHRVLPRSLRIGSAVSVVIYGAIGVVLFWREGVFGAPPAFVVVATWVLFAYFALGIVLNAISRSRLERMTMTPVCAVLAGCTFILATS